jgi:hypothetical protein
MKEDIHQIMDAAHSGARVRLIVVPQIRRFDQLFSGTVFPPFANPDQQAEAVAQKRWDELGAEVVGEDNPDRDEGDIAEAAQAAGLAFYETISAMHHTVLNLFTAGLFHLFEQQVGAQYRHWTGKTAPHKPLAVVRDWLRDKLGIDATQAPSWGRLLELELVANVVKHTEGRSAADLRALKLTPNTFVSRSCASPHSPTSRHRTSRLNRHSRGTTIYISKVDYDRFLEAVLAFLEWLAAELDNFFRGRS